MEKEFRHLTAKELARVLKCLRELRDEMNSFPKIAREDSRNFLRNAPADFSWANSYSMNMLEMLANLLVVGGMTDKIKAIPEEDFVFDAIQKMDVDLVDLGKGIGYSEYKFTALTIALIKSLHAIQLYGRSLNTMLRQIIAGDNDLLFEAVKVDATFVSNPEIARFLAIAELKGDAGFMKKLTNAMRGDPNARRHTMSPFRYSVHCLEELGQFEFLSEDQRFNLLAVDLKLYSAREEAKETFQRKVREYRSMSRIEISHNSIREKTESM